MATGITTYNDLTPAVREAYQRVTLDYAKKDQVYMQFAEKAKIDKRNGDRWLARRYDPYPVVTTPLTDGVVGVARKPTYTDISVGLEYYGDYTKITKRTQYTNLEDATLNITQRHGTQAGETGDTLMRNVLYSGASYLNASNGVNGDATATEVTYADLQTAVKLLRNNSAEMISKPIDGADKFNTSPIGSAYICFFHSDLRDDIRDLDTFVPVHQYGSKGAYKKEFGSVDDIRFIESNNGYVSGGYYSLFVIGENSYGGVSLSGETLNIYRKNFGSAGTSDPLDMFATVGWDMMWGGTVQNDSWMTNLRVSHS